MKRYVAIVLACAAASIGAGVAAADGPRVTQLRAQLRGLNEVPPTTSRATGELRAAISGDESSISFTLTYSGLTGNPGAAHIHFAPTKVNGGVMVFFCGGGGKPACPASTSGTVTGTSDTEPSTVHTPSATSATIFIPTHRPDALDNATP